MSHFGKLRGTLSRLMLLIGLLIVSVLPVRSWALAQNDSAPLWVVRTLHTSEYGVTEPKGLAFSSAANTVLLLDESGTVALVTMGEEHAGSMVIPEVQEDPLNAAFDETTGSLFVFSRGRSELAQIQADVRGLPDASAGSRRFAANAFGIADPEGIAFDPASGRLFILDAGTSQILSVVPDPTFGFDAQEAIRSNRVQHISLNKLGLGSLKGIAYNPSNGHLYVSEPAQKKLYELTQEGSLVSTFDLAALEINDPSAMTFAPSADNTDDPNIYDLFILDSGQTAAADTQVVELSLVAPAALPAGTTLLPVSLVQKIDTSKASWNPSAPDPAGVDYWPMLNKLLIADSEVDEMPAYFSEGKNVFLSTTSGNLTGTCTTISFSGEPTGVAINPSNNHIFFSTDFNDRIFEVSLGGDGQYCTGDDTVTTTNVSSLYNITDAEDVAYGNNTLFIAGGDAAEVYRIPLGPNGVLGGGDDGAMTHFDTAAMGFADMEALGYNQEAGTLFIASPKPSDRYLGEVTVTGGLVRAYDLSLMGTAGNIRSDVTYAPGSQGGKSIYIASRGVDNDSNSQENDGKIWEIKLSGGSNPTPTSTPGPGPSPTPTNPPNTTDLIFADSFESGSFSAWSANKPDSGDLSVNAAAALVGTRGMQAVIDDTVVIYVTDDRPNAEPRYRARFYFDPNSITMASGNAHFILNGLMGTSTAVLRLEFRFFSGAYQVRGRLINDASTWVNTNWFTISDAPHFIELDWRTAANNGGLTLWIDNVQQANLTGVDNDTRRIDRVRLGAVAGVDAGTIGTYYFDAFESRRQSFIGP
jgi:hypothetical protein